MNPTISIVMSVYNGEAYLREAVQSILDQNYRDFEFIIIDDGSTDGGEAIIRSFTDDRIRYEKRQHTGLIASLNYGVSIALGEYIARMDADDIARSDRLTIQKSVFDNDQDLVLCGSYAEIINETGDKKGLMNHVPLADKQIKKYLIKHNPFIHPTVMFKKNIFEKVGGYQNFVHIEDYELWSRIVSRYKVINIAEPLINYRIHSKSVTSSKRIGMLFKGILIRLLILIRFVTS